MSRLMIGLAMAVGLVGGAAMGQVGGKPEAAPESGSKSAAARLPDERLQKFLRQSGYTGRPEAGTRSFPGSPGVRPEPGTRGGPSALGGLGSRLETVPQRRPSEPPDPRAAMVAIQAVLLELVQDEAVKAPEGKPDPAPRGKSDPAVIDLDLAAPHDAIVAELRKLGARGRLEVLNRLQMTTLDRQPASVQFGRQEPFIMGTSVTAFGQTNSVELIHTGLLVGITPHVAPSDTVIMEIDLNESRPGRLEEGKAIFTSTKGETVRQPSILQAQFRSTVKAPAGKTVVVVAVSESGPRHTETLLLVSARVLNVKGD